MKLNSVLNIEIMLEFGLAGNIGRTLEKANCSVISFATEEIICIAGAVQERTVNELGVLKSEKLSSFERMVIGYLNLMRTNGAFKNKVFDEYTVSDGNGYMLSNDRNRCFLVANPVETLLALLQSILVMGDPLLNLIHHLLISM